MCARARVWRNNVLTDSRHRVAMYIYGVPLLVTAQMLSKARIIGHVWLVNIWNLRKLLINICRLSSILTNSNVLTCVTYTAHRTKLLTILNKKKMNRISCRNISRKIYHKRSVNPLKRNQPLHYSSKIWGLYTAECLSLDINRSTGTESSEYRKKIP